VEDRAVGEKAIAAKKGGNSPVVKLNQSKKEAKK